MSQLLPETELKAYCRFAQGIATEAGRMAALRYGEVSAQRKFDGSLVTEIDEAADHLITQRINAAYPDHAVLSEEQQTAYDPTHAYTWVIDPIDGTTNFARGLPIWGVSIGLLRHGRPVIAVIFFPLLHETYSAAAGLGATCNGSRISASSITKIESEYLLAACTQSMHPYSLETPLKLRNLGSAAYHLVKVADGTLLGAIESSPKIWDLAGAALILEEAGARMESLDGAAPFPIEATARDYKIHAMPVIAAGNDALLLHLRQAFGRA